MYTRTYTAIIRRENGGYVANSPEANLTVHGGTIEEALANLKQETSRILDGAELLDVNRPLMTSYDINTVTAAEESQFFTAKELLDSGIVGLWADRTDIGDSVEYAQQLRERAQTREHD